MPDQYGLSGAVAIVTGGTRGIGRAVAELFAAQGACLLATGSQPQTVADLRTALAGYGSVVEVLEQDMRDVDAADNIVRATVSRFGRIDIVVNNAGGYEYKRTEHVGRSDWVDLFELKTLGYWSLASAAFAHLVRSHGAVVNVAGVAGVVARPNAVHVGVINAGVISMTESLALAWASKQVRVNCVSPGATDTDRFATRLRLYAQDHQVSVEDARTAMSSEVPVGLPADPREVARVIAMLASPLQASLTGAHVIIDGASTLGSRRRS